MKKILIALLLVLFTTAGAFALGSATISPTSGLASATLQTYTVVYQNGGVQWNGGKFYMIIPAGFSASTLSYNAPGGISITVDGGGTVTFITDGKTVSATVTTLNPYSGKLTLTYYRATNASSAGGKTFTINTDSQNTGSPGPIDSQPVVQLLGVATATATKTRTATVTPTYDYSSRTATRTPTSSSTISPTITPTRLITLNVYSSSMLPTNRQDFTFSYVAGCNGNTFGARANMIANLPIGFTVSSYPTECITPVATIIITPAGTTQIIVIWEPTDVSTPVTVKVVGHLAPYMTGTITNEMDLKIGITLTETPVATKSMGLAMTTPTLTPTGSTPTPVVSTTPGYPLPVTGIDNTYKSCTITSVYDTTGTNSYNMITPTSSQRDFVIQDIYIKTTSTAGIIMVSGATSGTQYLKLDASVETVTMMKSVALHMLKNSPIRITLTGLNPMAWYEIMVCYREE